MHSSATQDGGWVYLINRLDIAKNWARRCGKTPLVREINTITKEGITGLDELILAHCSSLDTLITETFSQYGINYEIYGAIWPFTSYTAPLAGTGTRPAWGIATSTGGER